MKLLWVGDSPTVNTGFGIVSRNILAGLQKLGHGIDVLGVNYFGEWYDQRDFPYRIHPCEKGNPDQLYGIRRLWQLEEELRPDVVFFMNDPWIIQSYIQAKPENSRPYTKYLGYYPTDAGPIKKEWMDCLNRLDAQICYSHYAERVVTESNGGTRPKNLYQVYHGVDTEKFFPINSTLAKAHLGLPQDAFIVGMVARNQPRKRFDILMKAFADFAKDKKDVKLYLHTPIRDIGFDITELGVQLKISNKLILTKGLTPAQGVSDEGLNYIYNSFDVNTLISLGDGFGLPVAESMATGCPQLVSDHSCLKELVEGHGGLTVKNAAWILNAGGINTWGGVSDAEDLTKKLQVLYDNKDLRLKLSEDGYNFINQEKFKWSYAAYEMNKIIKEQFHILKREGK